MVGLVCRSALAALLVMTLLSSNARAALKFYYDPATGNVSFDTAETRSGAVYIYVLRPKYSYPQVSFNVNNWINLTVSAFDTARPDKVGEGTFGVPMRGLLTIGNVLPPGLSEELWKNEFGFTDWYVGGNGYTDIIGGGEPPNAELIYGSPGRPFDNKYDSIDPSLLKWAATAKLEYHAANGELVMDSTGDTSGYIGAFTIRSNGAFDEGYFKFNRPYSIPTKSSDELSITSDAIEPGRYSLGTVLPSGMSQTEFKQVITMAKFFGGAGKTFRSGEFDLTVASSMQLVYVTAVPEPGAALIAAGCLALMSRCRRRICV